MEENEDPKWVKIACTTSNGFNGSSEDKPKPTIEIYYNENAKVKPKKEYVYQPNEPVCIQVYTPSRYALGVTVHPQQEFEDLGYDVLRYEFVGIADCAIIQLDRLPKSLPSYAKRCRWDWNKHCLITD